MAKLHNYYVLCPLIDQHSFLGVAEDKKKEHVLVTLGRNVVNKYQLSDQKQVRGWTSKDHITATVIYDRQQKTYVGIFNNNTIKLWKEDSVNLDKLKKYKFPLNIIKVIPRKSLPSLVVFSNGNCASLPYAIENRKTYESKSLLKETDIIVDAASYSLGKTDYICYVVKNSNNSYEIIYCPLRDELGDMNKSKLNRVKISRPDDVFVVGKFISTEERNAVYVLWSDAKMTVYDFKEWKTIGTVPWISTLSSVSMSWMGTDHLILFGSNSDQDGAIIVAYNVILGVGSCRYPMKMYSENAKLHCFYNRIILEASNHIGMLPYVLETKRNIASLLGSHDIIEDEHAEVASWDAQTKPQLAFPKVMQDLVNLGLTERSICTHVIPPMIEKNDYKNVYKTIQEFKDVPESVLVMLVKYTVDLVNPDKIDVTDMDTFLNLCATRLSSDNKAKFDLLDYTFNITFSDALIIPHLRNQLNLNDTLFLLTYLTHLLVNLDNMHTNYESKLFDWCTLLMDAFYQHYLIMKDAKVTQVLQNTLDIVVKLLNQLHAMSDVMPTLNNLLSGKSIEESEDPLSYGIELMQI